MSLRERALLNRLRERDEDAFNEIVRDYQNKVFSLVYRMIGSREEAEDVAQDVFVTVFKHVETFRGDAKFSTWLYRIATNHTRNRMKYLGRRSYKATSELDEAAEPGEGAPEDGSVAADEDVVPEPTEPAALEPVGDEPSPVFPAPPPPATDQPL